MCACRLNPDLVAMARADWHQAGYGSRTEVVRRWAASMGVSYQTLYRALDTGRKRTADRGAEKVDGLRDAAMTVARIKKMSPAHKGDIATGDAITIAIANGLIATEMANRRSSIDRIIRECGAGSQSRRRVQRFQAERPNELHHVDGSTSECFYVDRITDAGDVILKLWKGHAIYKNKPVPTRLRPWLYGLTDDHSGVHVARYIAALGECAADNLDFLVWAWTEHSAREFFGLPEKIKGDMGPMMRGPEAQAFFERLGIEIDPSMPGNKGAHGKIERPWRTCWQRFERPFFVEDYRTFEIALDELNDRFFRYQRRYNGKPHRYERRLSRIEAWRRINRFGGAVPCPANALATIARRYDRRVGQDGVFHLDNTPYEVRGLHDADVWVFVGLEDENRIVVQDKRTGEKYAASAFTPNPIGTFRQPKDTGGEKARKAAAEMDALQNTLYTGDDANSKVVALPTRTQPAPVIDNPFDLPDAGASYPSLAAAVADFCALAGLFLTDESDEKAAVEGLILDSGLNRDFVRGLADEVLQENREAM